MTRDNHNDGMPTGQRLKLEETLLPAQTSIDLERTVENDYLYRFAASTPHIAELFHENSKLSPHSTLAIHGDSALLIDAKTWYFNTCYCTENEDFDRERADAVRMALDRVPVHLREMLDGVRWSDGEGSDLLYALDLLVLLDGRLLRVLPARDYLWVERRVEAKDSVAIFGSLIGLPEAVCDRVLLFIVGCPWRYMMLYGPRGYRHTLMDAGRLLALLERSALAQSLRLSIVQNFYDNVLDRFLLLDGTERSALAVAVLDERTEDQPENAHGETEG